MRNDKIYFKNLCYSDNLLMGLFSNNKKLIEINLEVVSLFEKYKQGIIVLRKVNYMYLGIL